MNKRDRYRALSVEARTMREGLKGICGMDERGHSILRYVETIDRCKNRITEQKAVSMPDDKIISKCNEVIVNSTESFKNALKRLGADAKCIKSAEDCLVNNDIDQIHYIVLGLLFKQNPTVYSKQYQLVSERIAQRGA